MSQHGPKAYLYQFSHVAPPWRLLGAFHASEICYVFGNLDAKQSFDVEDRGLSLRMMAYWINFAEDGDPNGTELPYWSAYDAKTDDYLEFGNHIVRKSGLYKSECDGLDKIRIERMEKRKGS
jgi:para-nitrobenzyl esterase